MTAVDAEVLRLRDVRLIYRRRAGLLRQRSHQVLDDINLDLHRGETLGIVGRNGCGKSTLLRLMSGILAPTSGSIELRENTSRAVLALGLGFRGELTGRDNAFLSAIMQGNSREQARSFLEPIKEFSELGDAFEQPVNTYSAGMRARLGFSSALLGHVDILFIDEILSVGDGHFRKKAGAALREKIRGDQTVVFVSHLSREVKLLCDRAAWLENGRLKRVGDPEDVVSEYEASL